MIKYPASTDISQNAVSLMGVNFEVKYFIKFLSSMLLA